MTTDYPELPEPIYWLVSGRAYYSKEWAEKDAFFLSPIAGQSTPVDKVYTADQLRTYAAAENAALRAEVAEQCLLNGKGSEREARLMGRVAELEREVERLRIAAGGRDK